MKKIIATVILTLTMVASSFAWETFAEYEVFCYANGIEPSYEEYEYYASQDGMCYLPLNLEEDYEDYWEKELARIMSENEIEMEREFGYQ